MKIKRDRRTGEVHGYWEPEEPLDSGPVPTEPKIEEGEEVVVTEEHPELPDTAAALERLREGHSRARLYLKGDSANMRVTVEVIE